MLQKLKKLFSRVKDFILGIFNESDANYIADAHFVNHRRHIQAHIDAIQGVYAPSNGIYPISLNLRNTYGDRSSYEESNVENVKLLKKLSKKKKAKKKSKKKAKKKTKRSSK